MAFSPSFSFSGWGLLEFLKGRKRMLVAAVGAVLGYVISDDVTVAAVAGALVEMAFALGEYFIKEVNN